MRNRFPVGVCIAENVGMSQTRTACAFLMIAPLLLAGGCGAALVRVPPPAAGQRPAGPPRIDRALDLGSLPLPEQGPLSTEHTDQLFTPGEWMALLGANLTQQSRLSVGGRPVPAAGYLAGGALLLRMPRGLAPGMQTVTLDNGMGTATVTLPTASYVYGADTQGNALRFRRLGPHGDGFADQALDIDFPKARFQVLSPDGGILYAVSEPDTDLAGVPSAINAVVGAARAAGDGAASCQLLTIHLGGKGGPRKVQAVPLALSSKPTGMAMGERGQLIVLQKRQLTVLDATDPLRPRVTAQLTLAGPDQQRELIDAEFLAKGRLLAVLEAYANQIHLIDFSDPGQPRQLPGVSLSRALDEPFSIDLAVAADGQSLWALQGPNLRLAGKRLLDGLRTAWSDAKALEFQRAAQAMGGAATGTAMLPREGLSRLVQLTLSDVGLNLNKSIALPEEIFPFFVLPAADGSLYVSGISRTNPFADAQASLDGVLHVLNALKNTAQLGTVIRVGTEDGGVTMALQGVAIYYDLALLPSGQLLTSTVRFGPGYLPPRLTLDWGLEVAGGRFTKLREVANTGLQITDAIQRLLPPYRYERIGAQ